MYAGTHIPARRVCGDSIVTRAPRLSWRARRYFLPGPVAAFGAGCATRLGPLRLSTTTVCSYCTSFDSRANTCTRLLPAPSGISASKSILVRSPTSRFGW